MVKKYHKILGVIPARFNSTRFKGKPLALIDGIPMIKRTYLQAKKSKSLDHLIVATCDDGIFRYCQSEEIPVVMTSKNCLTGTDRLAEVSEKFIYDLYINIQGDEPIIDPVAIDQIANQYYIYKDRYMVYNLYKKITNTDLINSKTIIKVIINRYDEMIYMSRLPIPFSNSNKISIFRQQIPVYGFTREALLIFHQNDKTLNEQFEDIELLRFSDLGYSVKMKETKVNSIAVDIPEDIEKVELFLKWS